jgi:predicted nucleic acid-binding protein
MPFVPYPVKYYYDSDKSVACVEAYARLRSRLEARGEWIGPHDQLIAATVLAHDGVLVTLNYREFGRIPGLSTEVWTENQGSAD